MKSFNIKELRKSSIYVTPNFSDADIQTKRYKIKTVNLFLYSGIYTLIVIFLTIMFLMILPSNFLFFLFKNNELEAQHKKIEVLENKLTIATNELAQISSTNKKLKYAIILGEQDSINTSSRIYDSLKHVLKKNNNIGGSILHIFREIFQDKKEIEKEHGVSFVLPVRGFLNKKFLPEQGHLGIDFAVVEQTPIMASENGVVIFSNYSATDGNIIMIKHQEDYLTVYKHCNLIIKKITENVKQGEVIALSGNSGSNTTGPHLHFEIWHRDKPINPEKMFVNFQ